MFFGFIKIWDRILLLTNEPEMSGAGVDSLEALANIASTNKTLSKDAHGDLNLRLHKKTS